MSNPKEIFQNIPQNYMNKPIKIPQQQYSPQIYKNNPIITPQQFYPQNLNNNQEIYQNYNNPKKNAQYLEEFNNFKYNK